ncbi:uncharacterized protein LOC123689391 [Pieris rapae]|uniref:uncharacterized protein LOC123689391 n=1 Tax=Pieris rapae TaxID=64459 RepID=UPI001E27DDE5|nr:uncharacterized protein LOC123689391 [Pieris rapae]
MLQLVSVLCIRMQFLFVIILALHFTLIVCKRKYKDSSSEESIENVLYYQDCKHKRDQPAPLQMRAVEPPTTKKPQECKMCCSMCCGEECQQSSTCNQQKPKMRQPQFTPVKKLEPARPTRPRVLNQNPFFARREFGLTKENIKSLISQDTDIRKILKDLVRVTMQKVDLMQLLKAKQTDKPLVKENEYENDL